jgi:uncharacterized protein YecT (DUF1311 family)
MIEYVEPIMKLNFLLLLSLIFASVPQNTHQQSDKIDEDDLRQYLAKDNDCQLEQIYLSVLEQVDFLNVGYPQAVVVAGTCMTGTAGPDVHSVFTRNAQGEITPLPMQELKLPPVLFGNSNSTFRIAEGILVEVYGDTSDREDPLIVKYRWNSNSHIFEIIAIEAAKPFPTSYDCDKAEKDGDGTALAICYVESLADLDIELAKLYKDYRNTLNGEEQKKLAAEQRAWLQQRNESCGIYKRWVDCLDEAYKKRIAELQSRRDSQKTLSIPMPKS